MVFKENAIAMLLFLISSCCQKAVLHELNFSKLEEYYKSLLLSSYLLSGKLSNQELGIAKLSGLREWLSLHPLIAGSEKASKMIIFAHHHKVLDGVQVHFFSVGNYC